MPWVRGYVRADATLVRGYPRWAPSARRETGILAGGGLAVVVVGSGGVASGAGTSPRTPSTMQYPVTFDTRAGKVPRPRPGVSYPIPWVREDGAL